MFKPCIIIPVYNHGSLLKRSVIQIAAFGHPIIIVDDGSNAETKNILQDIAKYDNITLITLTKNEGKGSAVSAGLLEAAKNVYSHALQIDADCQHNTNDIPIFLEQAYTNGNSVINGAPVYDESISKSRLYGRSITNFWVNIETCSYDIKDAMCGFRVYPVAAAVALVQKHKLSQRMGFDIEIIVRLHWMGIKIINQPTNVIYPKDGTSNFRMVADNIKISCTHTKLVFGLLYRLFINTISRIR